MFNLVKLSALSWVYDSFKNIKLKGSASLLRSKKLNIVYFTASCTLFQNPLLSKKDKLKGIKSGSNYLIFDFVQN